jgi:hypothetical protein
MKKGKTQRLVFEADEPVLEAGDMRPEYDFSTMQQVGERGRHAQAMRQGYTTILHHKDGSQTVTQYYPVPGSVVLDPDVRAYFPDADAVNAALRGLIDLIPAKRRAMRKTARQRKTET